MSVRRGLGVTIEQSNIEEQLCPQLRTATVQRLRATQRGDHGVCILLERERVACLKQLGARGTARLRRVLSAA